MAFPTSPVNGQSATLNGVMYTYSSATTSWTRAPASPATFSVVLDTFISDGITTSFNLSITPTSSDFVTINIDGVSQLKSAYALNGATVTLTGTPIIGAVIEIKTINATKISVLTGLVYDTFTGNGTTTTFTLSTSPTNKNFTIVTVGGLVQTKNNYNILNNSIIFVTAPPNTSPIEVTTFGPAITTATAAGGNTQVQFNTNGGMSGSANLTFNNSTNTLSTTNLTTANLTTTGTVKISGGTSNQILTVDGNGNVVFVNAIHPFMFTQ